MTERLTDEQLRGYHTLPYARDMAEELLALRARVVKLEGVIQTQNGVVVSGTLKLNEARARVAKLEAALTKIADNDPDGWEANIARAALKDAPQ